MKKRKKKRDLRKKNITHLLQHPLSSSLSLLFSPFLCILSSSMLREAAAARPALGARGAAPSSTRGGAASATSTRLARSSVRAFPTKKPFPLPRSPALQRVRAVSTEQPPVVGFPSRTRAVAVVSEKAREREAGEKRERERKAVTFFLNFDALPFFLLVRPRRRADETRPRPLSFFQPRPLSLSFFLHSFSLRPFAVARHFMPTHSNCIPQLKNQNINKQNSASQTSSPRSISLFLSTLSTAPRPQPLRRNGRESSSSARAGAP